MPTMPNLIGLQYQSALAAMVSAGVRVLPLGYFQVDPVTMSWLTAHSARPGTIVNQNPPPGTTVAKNSPVLLTASNFAVAVSSDGPVVPSELDVIWDAPNDAFILDESKLK